MHHITPSRSPHNALHSPSFSEMWFIDCSCMVILIMNTHPHTCNYVCFTVVLVHKTMKYFPQVMYETYQSIHQCLQGGAQSLHVQCLQHLTCYSQAPDGEKSTHTVQWTLLTKTNFHIRSCIPSYKEETSQQETGISYIRGSIQLQLKAGFSTLGTPLSQPRSCSQTVLTIIHVSNCLPFLLCYLYSVDKLPSHPGVLFKALILLVKLQLKASPLPSLIM